VRPRSALTENQRLAAGLMQGAKHGIACFMPPGEGKTAATLTAISDLGKPRTLVLAPARVADTVWGPEAAEWEHLRHLTVRHATGDAEQRESLVRRHDVDVVTLSYENFPWLLSHVDGGVNLHRYFDCIVFDELSRMKSVDSVKFRRFRAGVRQMKFRFGLTGTPVGNHLIDLWGEMYMVADERPLGPSKGEFVARYFAPAATMKGRVITWRPHTFSQREIEQRIKPFAFMLKPSATSKFQTKNHTVRVRLPAEDEELARNYADEPTSSR
jgi:SNF2 family DNA or RNA helicase